VKSTEKFVGTGLTRQMGLLGLTATGICSMIGASINVVPFMIHRNVPGIGPYVLPAFLFAAIPAILAAIAYGILASAMPRAGGSYVYASRSINPFIGFVASFSQWFGLSIVIGTVSYIIIPFFRDIAVALDYPSLAALIDEKWMRLTLSLVILWFFVLVNIRGIKIYERTLIPLMFLMFGLGMIVIVTGFIYTWEDFISATSAGDSFTLLTQQSEFDLVTFLSASALLFASFIGFDSIAQAGGEAKDPGRSLPLAIAIAMAVVGAYYFLFTAAVYNTVPWSFVAQEAMVKDISAPGLLSHLLPSGWTIAIIAGAAISLLNDLPSMLLAVSRLMFAWAGDGVFFKGIAAVHPRFHTPHRALLASGLMATVGILGCHFAGDFFLGVDIMVTSMLVNFLLMCISVLALPSVNPAIANEIKVIRSPLQQKLVAWCGVVFLSGFLIFHTIKDITTETESWYFHSTALWLVVMSMASVIFLVEYRKLKKNSVDTRSLFSQLPPE